MGRIAQGSEAAFATQALPAAIGMTLARLRTTPGRRIVIVSCSHLRRGSPRSGHRRQLLACESAKEHPHDAQGRDDKRMAALAGELSLKSDEFGQMWARHDVKLRSRSLVVMRHPIVGGSHFWRVGALRRPYHLLLQQTPIAGFLPDVRSLCRER